MGCAIGLRHARDRRTRNVIEAANVIIGVIRPLPHRHSLAQHKRIWQFRIIPETPLLLLARHDMPYVDHNTFLTFLKLKRIISGHRPPDMKTASSALCTGGRGWRAIVVDRPGKIRNTLARASSHSKTIGLLTQLRCARRPGSRRQ